MRSLRSTNGIFAVMNTADVISAGCTAAFLMELAEHNLLTHDELQELDIRWGNKEALIDLLHAIAIGRD